MILTIIAERMFCSGYGTTVSMLLLLLSKANFGYGMQSQFWGSSEMK